MDDNVVGLGVMLELVVCLKDILIYYGICFIVISGEEEGKLGVENLFKWMSDVEKKNMLLVINFDNLIVGDKFYFNSGKNMLEVVCILICDWVLVIVCCYGIVVNINLGCNLFYFKGMGCCNDVEVFDKVGILVFFVEVMNWNLGKKDGY